MPRPLGPLIGYYTRSTFFFSPNHFLRNREAYRPPQNDETRWPKSRRNSFGVFCKNSRWIPGSWDYSSGTRHFFFFPNLVFWGRGIKAPSRNEPPKKRKRANLCFCRIPSPVDDFSYRLPHPSSCRKTGLHQAIKYFTGHPKAKPLVHHHSEVRGMLPYVKRSSFGYFHMCRWGADLAPKALI